MPSGKTFFRSTFGPAVGLFVALAAVGCGPRLVPVHGKAVLASGRPAAGSQVVFEGEVDGKPISARGDVREDGSFEMGTYAPGDGVPPGTYRVQINPPPMVSAEAPLVLPFSSKYVSFHTSGIQFEVKRGQSNELNLKLEK